MVSNRTKGELASECTRLYSQTTISYWQIIPALNKGLELILDLGPSLGGGGGRGGGGGGGWGAGGIDNWYWPSLGDWLDLRL